MSFTVVLPPTSLETAVTATAAKIATALDTSQQPGFRLYELCSNTNAWYAQGPADTVFTAATSDICTAVAHSMVTGWAVQVSNSGGALPTGLSAATTYWVVVLSANTFSLATTRANAVAAVPTVIDITGAGSGTQTLTTVATAGSGSTYLPLGMIARLDGCNGAQVSILRDTADGKASITQVMAVR